MEKEEASETVLSNLVVSDYIILCHRLLFEDNAEFTTSIRDAIIKENPVKSGFLQIRGGGYM